MICRFNFVRFVSRGRVQSGSSDEYLVTRIQQDDADAWAVFLKRYTGFIYQKAYEYSQSEHHQTPEDLEDEVADLYLFMIGHLKNSLASFRGKCKPKTWVTAIVGNRSRILKAYLLHKVPQRADVRLPRILASRPVVDHEIFKRLVWGFDTAYIAQDLNVSEARCWEIEQLLCDHSPRVYDRIQANRASRSLHLSIDDRGDEPPIDVADSNMTPAQTFESREDKETIQKAIFESIQTLSPQERSILMLLYNELLKPADIVQILASNPSTGLPSTLNLNRIYYLKNRALRNICEVIGRQFEQMFQAHNRTAVECLESYFYECGFPVDRTSVQS